MFVSDLAHMLDDMLEHPDELFISSNSRNCALYSTADGAFVFLEGDFSGTEQECEQEVRSILDEIQAGRNQETR